MRGGAGGDSAWNETDYYATPGYRVKLLTTDEYVKLKYVKTQLPKERQVFENISTHIVLLVSILHEQVDE